MESKLSGVGVALVTPFKNDGSLDFESLEKLLDHVIDNGVDYLVVQGTTGESVTTSQEEKAQVLKFVIDKNNRKLPIVYGIGGNNTFSIIDTIKSTDLSSVDYLLSVSPYYNKPSQKGIIAHFSKIADESPIPVVLYNVPGRTASNLSAQTTIELSKHGNIDGIKEASGDLIQCLEISNNTEEDFILISGDDMLTIPIYSHGGKGVISVLANAFPENFKAQLDHLAKGNTSQSWKESVQLNELNPLMYEEGNPVGVKYLLQLMGIINNFVRLPLLPASKMLQEKIKVAFENYKAQKKG